MHALGRAQERGRGRIVQPAQGVGPRTRGVDRDMRVHGDAAPLDRVVHDASPHPSTRLLQRRHPRIARRQRAVSVGGPDVGEHQASVVAPAVVVDRPTAQVAVAESRLDALHRPPRQHPVPVHVAEQRQQVVQPQTGDEPGPTDAAAGVHGEDERQRAHQVGRDAQQDPPLAAGFEHQSQPAVLEIAEPSVDQPRRAARRAVSEVGGVHEAGADAAHRGVPGDPGAGDAAPDHQQVDRTCSGGIEIGATRGEREVGIRRGQRPLLV